MTVQATLAELTACCDAIDRRWRSCGESLEVFPEIVAQQVGSVDLTPLGSLEVLAELLSTPALRESQQATTFSDLHVCLYDNGRFWVEVLNWWNSDVNIHDHDFSGMQFQLRGDALNVVYSFVEEERYNAVSYGSFSIQEAELWAPAESLVVLPGRVAPHNVCHQDVPTVSLLIRTHSRPSFGNQWNYFPPFAAASYEVADLIFRKRLKALRLLSCGDSGVFHNAFRAYASGLSDQQCLFVLVKMIDILFTPKHIRLLEELSARRPRGKLLVQAVAHHHASEILKFLRHTPGLSRDARLALSIAAAALGWDVAVNVESRLGLPGLVERGIHDAERFLNIAQRRSLETALGALGMEASTQKLEG